jgi:hypothetical protein
MPIVHVHLRTGRSAAQKKAILDGLHDPPPLENWGIRGGQCAADVKLGFAIDV